MERRTDPPGRQTLLRLARMALASGRSVLLVGPEGIGKSRSSKRFPATTSSSIPSSTSAARLRAGFGARWIAVKSTWQRLGIWTGRRSERSDGFCGGSPSSRCGSCRTPCYEDRDIGDGRPGPRRRHLGAGARRIGAGRAGVRRRSRPFRARLGSAARVPAVAAVRVRGGTRGGGHPRGRMARVATRKCHLPVPESSRY